MIKEFYFDLDRENPIIKNHQVLGQNLLPGLAYLDILYQFAKDGLNLDYKEYVLKKLVIFNPLYVGEKEQIKLRITFQKINDYWNIKVEKADEAKVYITAELHPERILLGSPLNIHSIIEGAEKKKGLDSAYLKARKIGLLHKENMKAAGTIYTTPTGWLIDLQIDSKYADSSTPFIFSPILLDSSGVAASSLVREVRQDDKKEDLFLPLSYELFYCSEPVQSQAYVVLLKSSIHHQNDVSYVDLDYYNSEGKHIGILKGLYTKRVRPQNETGQPQAHSQTSTALPVKPNMIKNEAFQQLVQSVKVILARYVRVSLDQIDDNTGFFELGLESSQLLELVKEIESSLNVSLSASLLFEYANLTELVNYLLTIVPEGTEPRVLEKKIENKTDKVLESNEWTIDASVPFVRDILDAEQPGLTILSYPGFLIAHQLEDQTLSYPIAIGHMQYFYGALPLLGSDPVRVKISPENNKDFEIKLNDGSGFNGSFITGIKNSSRINIEEMMKKSKRLDQSGVVSPMEALKIGAMYQFDKNTFIWDVELKDRNYSGSLDQVKYLPYIFYTCFNTANSIENKSKFYFPVKVEKTVYYHETGSKVKIIKKLRGVTGHSVSFDILVVNETGLVLLELINAEVNTLDFAALSFLNGKNREWQKIPGRHSFDRTDIAVVGLSGRFPKARNMHEYWDNLANGVDCVTEIPLDRWNWEAFYDEDRNKQGKIYSKWGGFIDGMDEFDPLFFNISPREAEILDPQERLFLQCSYETIEDAGYTRETLARLSPDGIKSRVGVYVGVMWEEYQLYGAQEQAQGRMVTVGGNLSGVANRVSYILNLHGPSMVINTACSSSLTALHLASQGIILGECDAAIVGGVNLSIHLNKYLLLSQEKFVSSTGHCESFGKGGDGYVPGEGVGAVLLKPLSKAIENGDHIYGVIKASSINAGGKTSGYAVPSPLAQGDVIREAIEKSGIRARDISYIEAHGTGTFLGDPIEIQGLKKAFQHDTQDKQFCAIGSVKSNIGHCEGAAGVSALIKVLLQMKYRKLVPSLHAKVLNSNIDFNDSPFFVQQELQEWKSDVPRVAGISSFGAGGANAHVIVQEFAANPDDKTNALSGPVAIILSARDEERLFEKAVDLREWIKTLTSQELSLVNLAYTLQIGREQMEFRLGFLVNSFEELEGKLTSYIQKETENANYLYGNIKQFKEIQALFKLDEDLDKAVNNWIQKKKYPKLLDLWVKGLSIDWEKLYEGERIQKMSLPVYPFAREHYWIPQVEAQEGYNRESRVNLNLLEKVILVKKWRQKELQNSYHTSKSVIVVLGTHETRQLVQQMIQNNKDNQIVSIIHSEKNQGEGEINTDFYSAVKGEKLFKDLENKLEDSKISGVIDLTSLDPKYEESLDLEAGKIKLIQSLIENKGKDGFKILQTTYKLNNFQMDQTTLQGARLAGLYRMMGSEYKQIDSVTVDIDIELSSRDELAELITKEYFYRSHDNLSEYCYRTGKRYEPYMDYENSAVADKQSSRVYKKDDVVIITGGSKGIGASIAQMTVHQGLKKIVIIGREELPEQDTWKEILENQKDVKYYDKIKTMQSFMDKGVAVYYGNPDLSDEKALSGMLAKIHQNLGVVTGVFHCAGFMGSTPAFIKKDISDIERLCEPKIKGLKVLHAVLEKEPVEYFILFSSISAIVPALSSGQSDYAMANSFMDYYAMYQVSQGKAYFKSVQWPAWGETGMAAGIQEEKTSTYYKSGLTFLKTPDALKFLNSVMSQDNIVCAPLVIRKNLFQIQGLLKKSIKFTGTKTQETVISQKPILKTVVVKSISTEGSLKTAIKDWLKEVFMKELKLNAGQILDDRPFEDFGLGSIMIAQMALTLQKKVNTVLSPSLLLEYKTINDLTEYFLKNHASLLSQAFNIDENAAVSEQKSVETITEETEQKNITYSDLKQYQNNDFAVVGISCNFPGAASREEYWNLLVNGRSAITAVPKTRWESQDGRVDYGGFIDGIDRFDEVFFKIKEDDAAIMDPQARVILEESLKVVYDAGYEYDELSGRKIGVYAGGRSQQTVDLQKMLQATNPILGAGQNYIATNISRFFNFKGPSMVVDTACSSGLTALSLAMDAVLAGRIDMAIVGAVNLLLDSMAHEMFAARHILNTKGEFHIFDSRAGGEVLGEGSGLVMIKRLEDAVQDGNKIYGVVKALAINNDGKTLGPGSPNPEAQRQLMYEALEMSHTAPDAVGYIEVNGGGSPIVDSIEIKVLSDVYHLDDQNLSACRMGSIKPNIGHLLLTSGLAGFIRCMLSLHYKKIPPFLSAYEAVDYYDFKASRVQFNRTAEDWEIEPEKKRVAVLNSFPDGGTNCHIVMEEFNAPGEYEQLYFSRPVVDLKKKHFPLLSKTREIKPNVTSESKESIQNVWGTFDE